MAKQRKPKKSPRCEMPEMMHDTPQNVARAILRTRPPKGGWKYLKETKRNETSG